jgi:hypothetical protein
MRQRDIYPAGYNAGSIRPKKVSDASKIPGYLAYRFFMFAQGSMYHSAVEEDFRGIGDVIEDLQGFLELIILIVGQRLHPCLDFLPGISRSILSKTMCSWLSPASMTWPRSIEGPDLVPNSTVPLNLLLKGALVGKLFVRLDRRNSVRPRPRVENETTKTLTACKKGQRMSSGTVRGNAHSNESSRGAGSAEALLGSSARSCRERGVLDGRLFQLKGNQ